MFDILDTLAPTALALTAAVTGAIALGLGAAYAPKLIAHLGVSVFSKFAKK